MDTVFSCVIPYIQNGDDRNSVSLVCRKWNEIDCLTRKHVTVHLGYAPAPSRLSKRFPYLKSLALKGLVYDGNDDVTEWIREISVSLMHLKSLRIRYSFIRDSDLDLLAKTRGKDLMSLKLYACQGFSETGLMCVAKHCSELRELCVDEIDSVVCDKVVEERENWLRVLALRKTGIEKFSYMFGCDGDPPFGPEDLAFLVEKCRKSLVSLRVDLCDIADVGHAINNAVNLQDFFGAYFDKEEQCSGFTFPSSIHSLSLTKLSPWSIRFFNPLLNQLRELEFKCIQDCQCLFFQRCPNLEVLHASDECGDTGLLLISQFCRKLRKLTVHSGTHMGLMAVAQGCPNLEYLDVSLMDISDESLECVGSNLKILRVFRMSRKIHNPYLLPDNGIRALLMGCTKLERLDISKVCVTDVGLGFVGEYGVNLRYLSLCKVGESDEGLLKVSKGCLKLRKLEFWQCHVNYQAVMDLWLNIKSLRYISFNGVGCVMRPDVDMLAQVSTELKPYVTLAKKLDRLGGQLVPKGCGLKSLYVICASARARDELSTLVLRDMVERGIYISEEQAILDGPLKTPEKIIQVKIADVESRFMGGTSESANLEVEGTLKYGVPYLTKVGAFEVDVSLKGNIILCRQVDQPGIIGSVGTILGEDKVNVSFMSVGKAIRKEAVMAIVVDKKPRLKTLKKIGESRGVKEVVFIAL